MKKNKNTIEDLKILRTFMKEKKITFAILSKEMEYSKNHVITIFNGGHSLMDKFMSRTVRAIHRLLHKDLEEFYEVMYGLEWIPANCQTLMWQHP